MKRREWRERERERERRKADVHAKRRLLDVESDEKNIKRE